MSPPVDVLPADVLLPAGARRVGPAASPASGPAAGARPGARARVTERTPRPVRRVRRRFPSPTAPAARRARGLLNLEPIVGLPLAVELGEVGLELGRDLADAADAADGRRGADFVQRAAGIVALRALRRLARDLGI